MEIAVIVAENAFTSYPNEVAKTYLDPQLQRPLLRRPDRLAARATGSARCR